MLRNITIFISTGFETLSGILYPKLASGQTFTDSLIYLKTDKLELENTCLTQIAFLERSYSRLISDYK